MRTRLISILIVGLTLYAIVHFGHHKRPKDGFVEVSKKELKRSLTPPFPDLSAKLAHEAPDVAAAELFFDERIMTRFDAQRAVTALPCTDGMPDALIFAAAAHVLAVIPDATQPDQRTAVAELVSVGRGSPVWDGCRLVGGTVTEEVRTDTVQLPLERSGPSWRPYGDEVVFKSMTRAPLAGPLPGLGADWKTLFARADSIRKSRGSLVAHGEHITAGHLGADADGPTYPMFNQTECVAGGISGEIDRSADLDYLEQGYPALQPITTNRYAIFESRATPGRSCVRPVQMRLRTTRYGQWCGSASYNSQPLYFSGSEDVGEWPLLLINNLQGLRVGLSAQSFSIQNVPGWNAGTIVYSDTAEVLRIIETRPEYGEMPSGYRLNVVYRGGKYPIWWSDGGETEKWGLFWVGLLNADDIPDLIIRTTTVSERRHSTEHSFVLVLSTKAEGGVDGPWKLADTNTYQLRCESY